MKCLWRGCLTEHPLPHTPLPPYRLHPGLRASVAASRRTACMSQIPLVGPEPEVPEDLSSHSHPRLPPQPPNRAQSSPHDCPPSSHRCPPSSTFSLLKSGQGPHHIPVPKGIRPLPSRPRLPSLCINFSPPFEASLRSFLTATSPVAQPGPLLPDESRRTFGLLVNQHVIVRYFIASLCPSNALLICSICLIHLDYRGRAQGPGRCQPSPHPDSIALNLGTSAAKRRPPLGKESPRVFLYL